jgi:MFS transporter, DHA1 family, inner membrane transport protein
VPLPILALFLATFSIGTTEFVIAGLLPDVANDLGISIPRAGTLISGYAAGVAIGGPIVAILTNRFERKATLLGLMAMFIFGNALCALAPSYGWLMAARIVISFSHGACFGLAVVAAAILVPETKRAQAISLVIAGVAVANILGVPAGTAIGNALGWRATFWAIAALGLIPLAGMAILLPSTPSDSRSPPQLSKEFTSLLHYEVYLSLLTIVFGAVGLFGTLAYIAPLLTNVGHVSSSYLPWLLSLVGIGAFIGNLAGGRLADWKLMPSVIGIFIVLLLMNALMALTLSGPLSATLLVLVWSSSTFAFAAPLQSRVLTAAHEAPNLASTLISTSFNVGISSGAAIGGFLLARGMDYANLPWLGFCAALPALLISVYAMRADKRKAA